MHFHTIGYLVRNAAKIKSTRESIHKQYSTSKIEFKRIVTKLITYVYAHKSA